VNTNITGIKIMHSAAPNNRMEKPLTWNVLLQGNKDVNFTQIEQLR
jgi:hypothetical protein